MKQKIDQATSLFSSCVENSKAVFPLRNLLVTWDIQCPPNWTLVELYFALPWVPNLD